MKQASEFLNKAQAEEVRKAVADAESRTSVEIVPVIASSSGRYDRAEDVAGLWLGLGLAALAWVKFRCFPASTVDWGFSPGLLELLGLLLAVLAGFVFGASTAARVAWLRRLFTPAAQMVEEVEARAGSVFFDQRVHRTRSSTGLLIYLSLYERRAVVLADETVAQNLSQESIDDLCRRLTEGLRGGDPAQALCITIRRAGDLLAPLFPRALDDTNELPDRLVTLDD